MADLLTQADLAYMRETQAESRPTTLVLQRIRSQRSASGDSTRAPVGVAELLQARVWDTPDEVPQALADRFEGGTLVKMSIDIVPDVRSGDLLATATPDGSLGVDPSYVLVSDGEPDEWATAQIVWARRTDRPARVA